MTKTDKGEGCDFGEFTRNAENSPTTKWFNGLFPEGYVPIFTRIKLWWRNLFGGA